MQKIIRNNIEYDGISDIFSCDLNGFNYEMVEKEFEIDERKKRILRLIKASVKTNVLKLEIDNTYNSCNVFIDILTRCEYISNDNNRYIYTDSNRFTHSILINLINTDYKNKLMGSAYTEDIFIKKISDNSYKISISLLATVENINKWS